LKGTRRELGAVAQTEPAVAEVTAARTVAATAAG